MGLIPGLGRYPGEGNGNSLQLPGKPTSCLEIPMDRGAWRATVHGAAKSQTRLSTHVGYLCVFFSLQFISIFLYFLSMFLQENNSNVWPYMTHYFSDI